jgi:hypothetical protein
MQSKLCKFGIGIAMLAAVFFVQPVQANAPDVKVNVVVENSGVLMPVGGAYIRWRDGCGGSYGFKCALNDPAKTPRRYATTGVDGIHLFKKFQTADRGKEFATILDGFTDPDFPGPVRMMAPSAGQKFGCGQEDHKLAIMAQGYVCDEYKVGAPTTKASDYTKLGCPSGWCEGDLKFEGDCSNGCPQKEYTFKCKGQAIGDKKEVKRSEVGLGSDDPKLADTQKWGYACTSTQFCSDAANASTPVPTNQRSNYTACENFTSKASGAVKKKVKLSGVQSLYDKSYIQKQSEQIQAYIVECISISGKYSCTTGNPGMDTTIFGKSNVPSGYSIEMFKSSTKTALTNPVTYQQLDEDIVAISTYTQPISSFFMLVYPQSQQSAINVGSSSGQQQATLSNSSECRVVQDPYGRVFDTHTLEPLANTSVRLDHKNPNGSYEKVNTGDTLVPIVNPQTTKEDGMFSFNVVDGIYRLVASKAGYTAYTVGSELNSMFSQAYSNLYTGEDIVQSGSIIKTDIPLVPQDITASEEYARTNPVKVMNYLQSVDKKAKAYLVEGYVSHPNATVSVISNVAGTVLGRVDADVNGHFLIKFPLSKIQPGQSVAQLVVTKKKYGNKTTIALDPVFDSVRGYAYDQTGKLIPGAKVAVKVSFSDKPIFETTADTNGFFNVPSAKLPPIGYAFEFTSLNGTKDQVTTGSFMAQNIAHTNPNKYVAFNTDPNGDVMGAYTQSPEEAEATNVHSKVLLGAFLVLLVMAIPLSRMYTERNGKRKKK